MIIQIVTLAGFEIYFGMFHSVNTDNVCTGSKVIYNTGNKDVAQFTTF